MRASVGRSFLIALLLFAAGRAAPPWIESVAVEGTKRVLPLETRTGQALDPEQIAEDVRRLWKSDWFDDIRVETADTETGTAVTFRVVERPKFLLRRVRYEPGTFHRKTKTQPGAVLDSKIARRMAAKLENSLVAEGHADAEVRPEIVPVEGRQADLLLRVSAGKKYKIREARFSGDLGLPQRDLERALEATRSRRLRRPPYSEAALNSDLQRLGSLYISRGYLRAAVTVQDVKFDGEDVAVHYHADAGPQYEVRQVTLAETGEAVAFQEVCRCLMGLERESEEKGELDFKARLETEPAADPGNAVVMTALIDRWPAYTVARLDFRGHRAFGDLTLRRAMELEEGEPFNRGQLRKSLAKLNRLGILEPVTEGAVEIHAEPNEREVRLTIHVNEQSRGRWLISGPAGPARLGGALLGSISTRLPGWGSGLLEASTYFLSFQAQAFSPPIWKLLGVTANRPVLMWVSLGRPYLPGQGLQSGFWWSPQFGWRLTAASYGTSQLRHGLAEPLLAGAPPAPVLPVAVEWKSGAASGMLLCETPRSRWTWLKGAGSAALNLLMF
jgi:outer membrane protein assembly factor BamA